jgi:hypothetical protein
MLTAALSREAQHLAGSVALAVLPLMVFFVVFQVLFLRLPWREVMRVMRGTLLAAVGLFPFLAGVGVGFLPFGGTIGERIGRLPVEALLPFGFVLGFATTWGEPAVRILAKQVEDASTGSIRAAWVLHAICLGVALAVAVGLLRIAYDIPLLWLLLPGYVVVLATMWASDAGFVAVAVDAGGVATGPLRTHFCLRSL